MKLHWLGAAALALTLVTPVAAKDLMADDSMGPLGWSGFYVGVHGGYAKANRTGCGDLGFSILTFDLVPPPPPIDSCDGAPDPATFDYDLKGFVGGLQAGYNWTPSEMFLVGVEFSADLGKITGDVDGTFGGVGTYNSIMSATGKAGFIAGNFLIYGEGGVALANATFSGDLGCDFTMHHMGAVAGAGVSFKVTENASIDLKYDHYWLGAGNSTCNSLGAIVDPQYLSAPTAIRTQGTADVIKLGLNFQVGG